MSDNQESRKDLSADEIDQLLDGVAEHAPAGDDLLADFDDALAAGGADKGASVEEDEGDLSDLDAFLDEFEQSLDTDEAPGEMVEEPPAAMEGLAEEEPLDDRLPDDELPEPETQSAAAAEGADADLVEPEPVVADSADEPDAPELELEPDEPAEAVVAETPEASAAVVDESGLEELDHDFDSLDEDDLNLADEEDEEESLPEAPAVAVQAGRGDLFTDAVEDMELPKPDRPAVSAPAPAPVPAAPDRRPLAAAMVALVLAVAGSGSLGWLAMGLKGEVAELSAAVEALSGRDFGGASDPSRVDQLSREVGQLNQRLSELALLIEGPMSHVRESNRRELESIFNRLDDTEKRLSGVDTALGELKRAPVKTAVAEPRAAAPARPAAKAPSKPAQTGSWAVNLVSLSSRNTAERELSVLRQAGVNAELQQVTIGGKQWYRLRVTGFESKEAAGRYAQQIRGKTQIEIDPWLDRI